MFKISEYGVQIDNLFIPRFKFENQDITAYSTPNVEYTRKWDYNKSLTIQTPESSVVFSPNPIEDCQGVNMVLGTSFRWFERELTNLYGYVDSCTNVELFVTATDSQEILINDINPLVGCDRELSLLAWLAFYEFPQYANKGRIVKEFYKLPTGDFLVDSGSHISLLTVTNLYNKNATCVSSSADIINKLYKEMSTYGDTIK